MVTEELCFLSIAELAEQIKKRAVSPLKPPKLTLTGLKQPMPN